MDSKPEIMKVKSIWERERDKDQVIINFPFEKDYVFGEDDSFIMVSYVKITIFKLSKNDSILKNQLQNNHIPGVYRIYEDEQFYQLLYGSDCMSDCYNLESVFDEIRSLKAELQKNLDKIGITDYGFEFGTDIGSYFN